MGLLQIHPVDSHIQLSLSVQNKKAGPRGMMYLAWEGRTGRRLWQREAKQFRNDLADLQDELTTQFAFHVTAEHVRFA